MRFDIPEITQRERLKYEAAEALGLTEKLIKVGWGSLTARETGLIGALAAGKRVRANGKGEEEPPESDPSAPR